MRNLLALAAIAVLGFAAIGWYRGWYTVKTTPTANGGRNFNIDVNSPKISEDLKAGQHQLRNLLAEKAVPTQPTFHEGVPAVYRTSNGNEFILPGVDPDTLDISDHDGWWGSSH